MLNIFVTLTIFFIFKKKLKIYFIICLHSLFDMSDICNTVF